MRKTEDISFQFDKKEAVSENINETEIFFDESTKKTEPQKSENIKYVKEKKSLWEVVYEWMDSFVFSIILILIVFVFAFRVVGVDGESMMPTLNNGDWLTVKAINTEIERGDIVVITHSNLLRF